MTNLDRSWIAILIVTCSAANAMLISGQEPGVITFGCFMVGLILQMISVQRSK
jgi:hypothetical protein